MHEMIEKIYEAGEVTGRSGKVHKLHSAIDREEGSFLYSLIRSDETIIKTLEVGCAYGLSSLHICSAIKDRDGASHTIIDPFQNTDWDGVGIRNLESAGFGFFDLIEGRSEFVLPQLSEKGEGSFDFVFIDGWHTFDQTLLDCYYATRLLRVDGILAVDDVSFAAVKRVVGFLKTYPCYEEFGAVVRDEPKILKSAVARALTIPIRKESWGKVLAPGLYRKVFDSRKTEMVALRKVHEDQRNWDWHVDSF